MNIWAFQKDSFLEIPRTKPEESRICMVCFQPDPLLSGVKDLLSRGCLEWLSCLVQSSLRLRRERQSAVNMSGSRVDSDGSRDSGPESSGATL